MKISTIYALLDPATREPRYVGQTVNPPSRERAYQTPVRASNKHLRDWLECLVCRSQKYVWFELELCLHGTEANVAERQWIRLLRECGCDLLNIAPGGTSRSDYKVARASVGKWLALGQEAKEIYDRVYEFQDKLVSVLPKRSRPALRAHRALQLLSSLRFDLENEVAAEHPSWNVPGHFVGESPHPGRMTFCDVDKVPGSAERLDTLRNGVRDNLLRVPLLLPAIVGK